jgi:signal transduction histidine kinase
MRNRDYMWIALTIYALGLTTFMSYQAIGSQIHDTRLAEFEREIDHVIAAIDRQLFIHQDLIDDASSFLGLADSITQASFDNHITKNVERAGGFDSVGLTAMEWAPRIDTSDVQNFTNQMRLQDGMDDFVVWDHPNSELPLIESKVTYPVSLVTPLDNNRTALGLNLYSEQSRRSGIESAIVTSEVLSTEILILVQSDSVNPAYLLLKNTTTKAGQSGVVLGVFEVNSVIDSALSEVSGLRLAFHLSDGESHSFLYGNGKDEFGSGTLSTDRIIEVFGHEWHVSFSGLPSEYASGQAQLATLVAGVLVTFLSASLVFVLVSNRREKELAIKQKTSDLVSTLNDLEVQRALTEHVIESTNEGLLLVDSDRNVVWVNPALAAMFDFDDHGWNGKPSKTLAEAAKPKIKYFEEFSEEIAKAYESDSYYELDKEVEVSTKGGMILSRSTVPVKDSHGGYIGRLWTYRDRTAAVQAERARTNFLSIASHELRTPLTSMRGSLALLNDGFVDAESKKGSELIEVAARNTNRLIGLVNDLLDYERIESGRMPLAFDWVNISLVFEDAREQIQDLADSKNISLGFLGSARLYCDPVRITQVLVNLLSNSVKFTPENGTISVAARHVSGSTEISVIDEGLGIKAGHADEVFCPFFQIDSTSTRTVGGTGLGLAISRAIIEAHEGRIWVDETHSNGSKFVFSIPGSENANGRSTPTVKGFAA